MVKLTRDEREDRAKQAAERAKDAGDWRSKEASFKQNAKDAKDTADSCTKECERLLAQVRSGEECRQVDVHVEYDEVRDMLVRIRLDTGEVISERKADESDRDRINMKRRRLVEAVVDGCQMPHWFEKVRRGAPASSNGEYLLAEDGCYTSYLDGYRW